MSGGTSGARIVVQIRWQPPAEPDVNEEERARVWSELAPPLCDRAMALGGRLVGWGDRFLTVDFSWDGMYDAIDFLVDAPLLPELASGVCHGHVHVFHESPRMALATGEAVHRVTQLSKLARPGEVLVDPALVAASAGRLGSVGEAGRRPGRPEVRALILDPATPLRGGSTVPPTPSAQVLLATFNLQAPPSLAPDEAKRLTGVTDAVRQESDSTFPAVLATALREKTSESLARLLEKSHATPESPAAERLAAMTDLLQGQGGEAVRRLRVAKEQAASGTPSARCRASLALAVALAALGRAQEATLEGLTGLARAREGGDDKGQRACARFLANMAEAARDSVSAGAWDALCH